MDAHPRSRVVVHIETLTGQKPRRGRACVAHVRAILTNQVKIYAIARGLIATTYAIKSPYVDDRISVISTGVGAVHEGDAGIDQTAKVIAAEAVVRIEAGAGTIGLTLTVGGVTGSPGVAGYGRLHANAFGFSAHRDVAKVGGHANDGVSDAPGRADAAVMRASQTIIAIYWGAGFGRTTFHFAVARIVHRTCVPIITDLCAQGVAGTCQVAMSQMSGESILANPDGVEIVSVPGWEVTDIHLGGRCCLRW